MENVRSLVVRIGMDALDALARIQTILDRESPRYTIPPRALIEIQDVINEWRGDEDANAKRRY